MNPALEQLVREAMDLTGAPKPDLLEEDAPVPGDDALSGGDEGFYLVGLIGGKDVGKSALINALVAKPITAVTSYGAGTETVIAYAHSSQEQALRSLLEREASGQFRIVTHDLERLRRQVLLDLPDIDSRYASHLQLTRTMLRHMLYPVWVGSLEKYADQQPQQMLARVAEGNSPENFVFCLNKVDQLTGVVADTMHRDEDDAAVALASTPASVATPWGMEMDDEPAHVAAVASSGGAARRDLKPSPLDELRADYAGRLAGTLKLAPEPQVFLVSAKYPGRFDLPALRELLSRQKSAEAVRESKLSAAARQDKALFAWLDARELPMRAERLAALQRDAQELVTARVAGPVLEKVIPRLLDDPVTRSAMADEILQERVAHWPIVNLVHTPLQPLFILLRAAVSRSAAVMQGADAMVDGVMQESGESVTALVQSAFVQLRQAQPAVAALYLNNKLWEETSADRAATGLRRALAETVRRQRAAARQRFARGGFAGAIGAPFRWLLTLGALLWFPFLQPILLAALARPDIAVKHHWPDIATLFVTVLGVDYLLKSAGFLIIYYIVLWLALRWNTQRKVARMLTRWRASDFPDASINLATQTVKWLDDLIAPIATAREKMQSLAERVAAMRSRSEGAAASAERDGGGRNREARN
jgi:hypothetical protein